MLKLEKHIEARIRFLPVTEGGRAKVPFSGYRPQFYYDGRDWDATILFDGNPPPNGEYFVVHFSFVHPKTHEKSLGIGKIFQIREGSQVVATGVVTQIIDLSDMTK